MSWIKKGIAQIADPEKEQRVEDLALKLQKELRRLMRDFDLADVASKLAIDNKDLPDVCLKAFSNILGRAWEDGDLSESEAKSVNWAAQVLGVPVIQAGELKIAFGKAWFERHLARAFDDGEVTPEEHFNSTTSRSAWEPHCRFSFTDTSVRNQSHSCAASSSL